MSVNDLITTPDRGGATPSGVNLTPAEVILNDLLYALEQSRNRRNSRTDAEIDARLLRAIAFTADRAADEIQGAD